MRQAMEWKNVISWFQPAPQPRYTLRDFMAQMDQVQPLGRVGKFLAAHQLPFSEAELEAQMRRMRAIYNGMTRGEREKPQLLNGSRRSRIAAGAGVPAREVAAFLQQFEISREMMDRVRGLQ